MFPNWGSPALKNKEQRIELEQITLMNVEKGSIYFMALKWCQVYAETF